MKEAFVASVFWVGENTLVLVQVAEGEQAWWGLHSKELFLFPSVVKENNS